MKKLLKTLLIATASIGTIAAGVATVVSCGEADTTSDTPEQQAQNGYENEAAKAESEMDVNALTKDVVQNIASFDQFTVSSDNSITILAGTTQDFVLNKFKAAVATTGFINSIADLIKGMDNFDVIDMTKTLESATLGMTITSYNSQVDGTMMVTIPILAKDGVTIQADASIQFGVKYVIEDSPAVTMAQYQYDTEVANFSKNISADTLSMLPMFDGGKYDIDNNGVWRLHEQVNTTQHIFASETSVQAITANMLYLFEKDIFNAKDIKLRENSIANIQNESPMLNVSAFIDGGKSSTDLMTYAGINNNSMKEMAKVYSDNQENNAGSWYFADATNKDAFNKYLDLTKTPLTVTGYDAKNFSDTQTITIGMGIVPRSDAAIAANVQAYSFSFTMKVVNTI